MRSYAVIPPLMLDAKQKRYAFQNENGIMHDMEADFKVNFVLATHIHTPYFLTRLDN